MSVIAKWQNHVYSYSKSVKSDKLSISVLLLSLSEDNRHYGLVGSAPAWDGTGCEFDSWQCRIYIPCSLSLRLLGSFRGSLGTYGLTQKLCKKQFITVRIVIVSWIKQLCVNYEQLSGLHLSIFVHPTKRCR